MYYDWRPYVPVAKRRQQAQREVASRQKAGQSVTPVVIEGRTIARTFWGKAWCDNLEHYSDYANRLPRGRTYVRNGSVVDLQIAAGKVMALVSGSMLYKVQIEVVPLPSARWDAVRADCAGGIDSMVELLQGRLSKGVMERICRPKTGLFPAPAEIQLRCSCPDGATMCKHVAAALYGVGARLDERPELLFRLRGVHEAELVAQASQGLPLSAQGPAADKVLQSDDLSGLFELDFGDGAEAGAPPAPPQEAARAAPVPPEASRPRAGRPKAAAPGKTAKPAASEPAVDKAGLRAAIANVETRLTALRAEQGAGSARMISVLEDWLQSSRAKLSSG